MEAVLFIGIQGSGKTTFYRERFFETHLRLSLDMLRTRRRMQVLLDACLVAQQRFVLDNTNVTYEERARYIGPSKTAGFRIVGYFFVPDPQGAFARNMERIGRSRVPSAGLFGTLARLQRPSPTEGFDELWQVRIPRPGAFEVQAGSNEL